MPNWDNLHGGALIQYLFICWFCWPLISAIFLVVAESGLFKFIGLLMFIAFCVFAWNRPVEFFFCFCFLPASIIGAVVRAFAKGVRG